MDSSDAKLPLRQSKIYNFRSIARRTWTVGICLSCTIDNYSDLQNSVYYYLTRKVFDSEFTLKVIKKLNHHYFELYCNMEDDMIFYVMYNESKLSARIPAKLTEYGYWIEVPKEIVYDSRNTYLLNKNSLVVQLHGIYNSTYVRTPFTLCETRTRRDEELFSTDMLKLYERREETGDFSLKARGKEYTVHKFVFAARTRWFKCHPSSRGWNQIYIQGEPLIMDKVVRYIYSGVMEEIEFDDMLKVLEVAVTLQVTGLIQTISGALRATMTEETALEVLKQARKLKVYDLITYSMVMLQASSPEEKKGRKNRRRRRR